MARPTTTLVSLTRFQAELERLLREALELSLGPPPAPGEWQPPLDVVESDTAVTVLVELPGVSPAQVTVEVRGKRVSITGRKRSAGRPVEGDGFHTFHCMECQEGTFERTVDLITAVDTHRARARFVHGVLCLELPKVVDRRERPRTIAIDPDDQTD